MLDSDTNIDESVLETEETVRITASDCTLRTFMQCMFEGKIDLVGGRDAWEVLYTEYIDLSGMANTKECTLLRSIHNIECRLHFIESMINIIVDFYNEFQVPFTPAFEDLKTYGHKLTWPGEWKAFEVQLRRIETKEKRYIAEKDSLKKEYDKLRKNGMKAGDIKPADRKDFIRLLNHIGKFNKFSVDKDKTTVEEFALMVKDYSDHIESQQSKPK